MMVWPYRLPCVWCLRSMSTLTVVDYQMKWGLCAFLCACFSVACCWLEGGESVFAEVFEASGFPNTGWHRLQHWHVATATREPSPTPSKQGVAGSSGGPFSTTGPAARQRSRRRCRAPMRLNASFCWFTSLSRRAGRRLVVAATQTAGLMSAGGCRPPLLIARQTTFAVTPTCKHPFTTLTSFVYSAGAVHRAIHAVGLLGLLWPLRAQRQPDERVQQGALRGSRRRSGSRGRVCAGWCGLQQHSERCPLRLLHAQQPGFVGSCVQAERIPRSRRHRSPCALTATTKTRHNLFCVDLPNSRATPRPAPHRRQPQELLLQ
jgi:hypothetical protein